MYYFFRKWKDIQTDIFSLKEEIEALQHFYSQKIFLWQKISDGYYRRKIDFAVARELFQIYDILESSNLYQQILQKLRNILKTELFSHGELKQFYDLVLLLHMNEEKQNSLAKLIIPQILSGKFPETSQFYALKDLIKIESDFFLLEEAELKKVEDIFLIKKNPGGTQVNYIPILDALQKGVVKVENNQLFVGDIIVQGVAITDNTFFIKGDHYTSLENARSIEREKSISVSLSDPYVYLVEKGKFSTWTKDQIRKNLGIKTPETVISLEIQIFPEQLYIRRDKSKAMKFAIASLQKEEIIRVVRKDLLAA